MCSQVRVRDVLVARSPPKEMLGHVKIGKGH